MPKQSNVDFTAAAPNQAVDVKDPQYQVAAQPLNFATGTQGLQAVDQQQREVNQLIGDFQAWGQSEVKLGEGLQKAFVSNEEKQALADAMKDPAQADLIGKSAWYQQKRLELLGTQKASDLTTQIDTYAQQVKQWLKDHPEDAGTFDFAKDIQGMIQGQVKGVDNTVLLGAMQKPLADTYATYTKALNGVNVEAQRTYEMNDRATTALGAATSIAQRQAEALAAGYDPSVVQAGIVGEFNQVRKSLVDSGAGYNEVEKATAKALMAMADRGVSSENIQAILDSKQSNGLSIADNLSKEGFTPEAAFKSAEMYQKKADAKKEQESSLILKDLENGWNSDPVGYANKFRTDFAQHMADKTLVPALEERLRGMGLSEKAINAGVAFIEKKVGAWNNAQDVFVAAQKQNYAVDLQETQITDISGIPRRIKDEELKQYGKAVEQDIMAKLDSNNPAQYAIGVSGLANLLKQSPENKKYIGQLLGRINGFELQSIESNLMKPTRETKLVWDLVNAVGVDALPNVVDSNTASAMIKYMGAVKTLVGDKPNPTDDQLALGFGIFKQDWTNLQGRTSAEKAQTIGKNEAMLTQIGLDMGMSDSSLSALRHQFSYSMDNMNEQQLQDAIYHSIYETSGSWTGKESMFRWDNNVDSKAPNTLLDGDGRGKNVVNLNVGGLRDAAFGKDTSTPVITQKINNWTREVNKGAGGANTPPLVVKNNWGAGNGKLALFTSRGDWVRNLDVADFTEIKNTEIPGVGEKLIGYGAGFIVGAAVLAAAPITFPSMAVAGLALASAGAVSAGTLQGMREGSQNNPGTATGQQARTDAEVAKYIKTTGKK